MFFDDWEQLSKPTIRPATPSDVRAIARIHVDGWKSTYQDVLPADALDRLTYADRERTWMRLVAGGDSGPYVLVADHPERGIVAFVAAGPERSDNAVYSTEAYALYVAESHQRQGIGRALLQYVAQIMSENAQQGLLAWAFSESPTNAFFERLGAVQVTTRSREFGGSAIEETAFGWPDIRVLLEERPAPGASDDAESTTEADAESTSDERDGGQDAGERSA
jgi:L-amino acid N-acyltransferase YncA